MGDFIKLDSVAAGFDNIGVLFLLVSFLLVPFLLASLLLASVLFLSAR